MAKPQISPVNRDDDDYTEKDLEKDLKKTRLLPFAQIGTPSPYRGPPKSRIDRREMFVKPLQSSEPVQPIVKRTSIAKALFSDNIEKPSTLTYTDLPEGLKTPTSNPKQSWSAKPIQESTGLPKPNFQATDQQKAPTNNSNITSSQKSKVKVVASRYMQTPKSTVNKENPPSQQKMSAKKTIPSTKKTASTQQKQSSVLQSIDQNRRVSTVSTQTKKPIVAAKPLSNESSTLNTTSNTSRSSIGTMKQNSSVKKGLEAVQHLPSNQREILLARREQRLQANSTIKKSLPTISRMNDSSTSTLAPSTNQKPTLVRQSSAVVSTKVSGDLTQRKSTSNRNSLVYHKESTELTNQSSNIAAFGDQANYPKTPGSLKKSHSTSSLLHSSSKVPATQAAQIELKSGAKNTTLNRSSVTSIPVSNNNAWNLQAAQLETQLLQTQLLQWHFINHRLEHSFAQKQASASQMMFGVWNKIIEMKKHLEETKGNFDQRQSIVYEQEMEEFKISCVYPLIKSLDDFMENYQQMAVHLSYNTHRMPVHGISPLSTDSSELGSSHGSSSYSELLEALNEAKVYLSNIQIDFSSQITKWQKVGQAMNTLSSIVTQETKELHQYSEMLHALATLSTHERSLTIQKIEQCSILK